MKRIAIFKPGKHKPDAPNFTAADLKRIAASYDPAKHEAPLVVGHPATNKPAFGWVDSLSFKDGTLWANLKDVHKGFAQAVKDRRYPKISSAFYKPAAWANPAPGGFSLRHVGFLGAEPAAVAGLPAVAFAAGDDEKDFVSVEFAEDDGADDGADGEDEVNLSETITKLSQRVTKLEAEKPMSEKTNKPAGDGEGENANFAEREAELNKQAADLKRREAELNKREADRLLRENTEFVEGVVKEGKVLPRHKDGLAALLTSLKDGQTVTFAAADSKDGAPTEGPAREFVKDFLKSLPEQINYAEIAKDDGGKAAPGAGFKAPAGMEVDKSGLEFYERAKKLSTEKNITFAEAATQLSGG